MYLLIQFSVSAGSAVASAFTFHNVSINSQNQSFRPSFFCPDLHPIMYLLIQYHTNTIKGGIFNLHSIMYLLIPSPNIFYFCERLYLHSIMYLLILLFQRVFIVSRIDLHSIMYLLIQSKIH